MRAIDDFSTYYQYELSGIMSYIESKRREALLFILKSFLWLTAICIGIGVFFSFGKIDSGWNFATGFAAFFAWAAIGNRKQGRYVSEFKNDVIPAMVQFIHPGLFYNPGQFVSEEEFKGCGLFRSPDRYNGKDYIEGYLDRTHVCLSVVNAEYKTETTTTDDNGYTRTEEQWDTIFSGILFSADFNKWLSGYTCVTPRGLFQSGRSYGGSLVKLEVPEFSKYFTVYGTDQIEARYILSTSLMQRLVSLRKKMNCKISLAFTGSRVFITIPARQSIFEPRFFRAMNNSAVAFGYFYYLHLLIGIVEDLNLNTRIWRK